MNVWLPLAHPLLGTWPATLACALTGNRTSYLSVCRLALNPLWDTSQGGNEIFISHFFHNCTFLENMNYHILV